MKTNSNSYPNLIVKKFYKTPVLFLIALVTTTLLVSCTADEIEVQPKPKTTKDIYFQRKDSIITVPTTNTTTTTTSTDTGEIVPPVVTLPPPPKTP
jgi:hypothetical protein